MSAERSPSSLRAVDFAILVVILAVALAARCWYLTAGVPHAVGIDEPQVVNRSLRILQTGDWNPHLFDYPTLVIYFHAAVAILRFLWGALEGEWASLDGYRSPRSMPRAGSWRRASASRRCGSPGSSAKSWRRAARRRCSAAAQLAVQPIHVRESHFILTDVPMTALTTLAVWLAVRAARLRTIRGYAWAGAACGLAAAAKYNGGVALVAVAAAWLRPRTVVAGPPAQSSALPSARLRHGFVLGAPFTVLDMPGFLDGFASAVRALRGVPSTASDPAWLLYVKHLSPRPRAVFVPLALAGAAILLLARARPARAGRRSIVFTAAYFYMLSSHSHVFGRYALPLLPMLCLFASVALFAALDAVARVPALAGRAGGRWRPPSRSRLVLLGGVPPKRCAGWTCRSARTRARWRPTG